jgi:hypothetical protein
MHPQHNQKKTVLKKYGSHIPPKTKEFKALNRDEEEHF